MCSSDVIRLAASAGGAEAVTSAAYRDKLATTVIIGNELMGKRRAVDLTHVTTEDFPVFPGDPTFRSRTVRTLERHGYALQELSLSEHTGTHLDAPAHFFSDGTTADNLPLAELIVPLVVISLADRAGRDHDTRLEPDDVVGWERRHGRIPDRAVVALHTGWEERLSDPARYLNLDDTGVMHTPGFSGEAAEMLVHERSISGVAVDTLSLDIGASTSYPTHVAVLGAGRYGLENVANLGVVPPTGATLIVGGPRHSDATGGPARLIALF